MNDKVNNYKAAKELDLFKAKYMDPLNARVKKAEQFLQDQSYQWKPGQKEKAKDEFMRIDTRNIDFTRLYNDVKELVTQHEALTDLMASMYSKWLKNISSKGKQPKELMSMQAEILEEMFSDLKKALEPLNLDLG
jgi:hypothetical protein